MGFCDTNDGHHYCESSLQCWTHTDKHTVYNNIVCMIMLVSFQINVVFLCFAMRALWKSRRHHFSYKDKEAESWKLAMYYRGTR